LVKLTQKDGEELECDLSASVRRKHDRLLGYEIVFGDAAARKQAERKQLRLLEEFERTVQARTRKLMAANDKLRLEAAERQRKKSELRLREERFTAVFHLKAVQGRPDHMVPYR